LFGFSIKEQKTIGMDIHPGKSRISSTRQIKITIKDNIRKELILSPKVSPFLEITTDNDIQWHTMAFLASY